MCARDIDNVFFRNSCRLASMHGVVSAELPETPLLDQKIDNKTDTDNWGEPEHRAHASVTALCMCVFDHLLYILNRHIRIFHDD